LEKKRKFERIKLAFCWTFGLWPKPPTTVYDLMSMGSKLGMDLVYGCPEGYEPKEDVETAKKVAKETKGSLEIVRSLEEAANGADVIYLKSWVLPGLKDPKKEAAHLREPDKYRNWIVNNDLLDAAKRDVIVMNAMPAIRGEELTEEVFEGSHSVLFDEAENRLHAQKGILSLLL
jgi:ornithine carbamoyltransferase